MNIIEVIASCAGFGAFFGGMYLAIRLTELDTRLSKVEALLREHFGVSL